MINVPNRPDIHVRLAAVKFLFRHDCFAPTESSFAVIAAGNPLSASVVALAVCIPLTPSKNATIASRSPPAPSPH
jgi:hypothetical protein